MSRITVALMCIAAISLGNSTLFAQTTDPVNPEQPADAMIQWHTWQHQIILAAVEQNTLESDQPGIAWLGDQTAIPDSAEQPAAQPFPAELAVDEMAIPPLREIESQPPVRVVIFPRGDLDWRPFLPLPDPLPENPTADVQQVAQNSEMLPTPLASPGERAIADGNALRSWTRLQHLQRSVSEIALSTVNPVAGPPDEAQGLSQNEEKRLIPSGEWISPVPNRYPVGFMHQPLYFEEVNLERCGAGHGFLQPLCSSGAFLGNTIILPFKMVAQPPCECVPARGDCLTCQRWTFSQLLWTLDCE